MSLETQILAVDGTPLEAAHAHEDATTAPVQITPMEQRRTSRFLTKYEIAKVVGVRAKEIAAGIRYTKRKTRNNRAWGLGSSNGGPVVPPMTPDTLMQTLASGAEEVPAMGVFRAKLSTSDPVYLAKKELVHHRIPFVVRRTFPDGETFEDIPLSDLAIDEAWLNLEPKF